MLELSGASLNIRKRNEPISRPRSAPSPWMGSQRPRDQRPVAIRLIPPDKAFNLTHNSKFLFFH